MGSDELYEAITDINETMNKGFAAVYEKIDTKFTLCDKRLGRVETIIAVKEAICKKEQKNKDYWKWIIRAASVMGISSLMMIFGKLIIFGSKLP